ncbi:MAG TPA: hypothetical protein VF142_05185 [Longimicrobium sp.]
MIVEYVRYEIAEGRGPEFEAAYARAAAALDASPHWILRSPPRIRHGKGLARRLPSG